MSAKEFSAWALVLALSSVSLVGACATTPSQGESEEQQEGSEADALPMSDDTFGAGGFNTGSPAAPGSSRMGQGGPRGDAMPSVTFEKTAEANWAKAEEAFADEDYPLAQRYFAYIRSKYPYSQYALPSELRTADCMFARERWLEAIEAYQSFVRMHPTHPDAPYAYYRVGLGFTRQIPGDWFLIPPSEEKDQAAVRDAERALKDFIERFPSDKHVAEAEKTLAQVRSRLVAHERYAANFYQKLGRDRAYVGRLEVIRRDFADVALDDALLLEIATVWARLGEAEKAKNAVAELEVKYPASKRLKQARSVLSSVPGVPAPAATPKTSTSSAAGL